MKRRVTHIFFSKRAAFFSSCSSFFSRAASCYGISQLCTAYTLPRTSSGVSFETFFEGDALSRPVAPSSSALRFKLGLGEAGLMSVLASVVFGDMGVIVLVSKVSVIASMSPVEVRIRRPRSEWIRSTSGVSQ